MHVQKRINVIVADNQGQMASHTVGMV